MQLGTYLTFTMCERVREIMYLILVVNSLNIYFANIKLDFVKQNQIPKINCALVVFISLAVTELGRKKDSQLNTSASLLVRGSG